MRRSSPRRIAGPFSISCQTPRSWSAAGGEPRKRRRARGARSGSRASGASVTSPAPASARRASFTEAGNGWRPASENSRAAGVASGGRASAAQARNSRGSPSQTTRPRSSAMARSAAGRQRSRRCSAITIVVPHSSLSRRKSQISSSPATGSSCEVGSSSSSSSGLWASAPASATRCSSPPDSVSVRRSSSCAMPSASAASSTARATAAAGSPRCSSASAISARTPLITTCDSGSWNSVPQTRESSLGPCSRTDMPATASSPDASPPWKCGTTPHAATQQRGLAAAGLPGHDGERPGLELQRQLAERGPCGLRVAVGEVLGEQDRLRHAPPPAVRPRRRKARPTTAAGPPPAPARRDRRRARWWDRA